MVHKCVGIEQEVSELNGAIDSIEKLVDTWYLKYYHSRLQERHDILITNRDLEIQNLKDRITELEEHGVKEITNTEKIDIHLIYDKPGRRVMLNWGVNSKKRDSIFDECGRKWLIPKLNDDSYIKIKFIGKKLDEREKAEENRLTFVNGLSTSSAIIGNTTMGRGSFKDIKNNFILEKKPLRLLLISQDVWFYVLSGTEDIELIGSSEDINATLDVV